jgi:F1F0 ATPase subunit 2
VTELLLPVALALLAGVALGLFYFGGLWLTVQRVTTSQRPELLALGSFVLRMAVTLAGFLLGHGRPLGKAGRLPGRVLCDAQLVGSPLEAAAGRSWGRWIADDDHAGQHRNLAVGAYHPQRHDPVYLAGDGPDGPGLLAGDPQAVYRAADGSRSEPARDAG